MVCPIYCCFNFNCSQTVKNMLFITNNCHYLSKNGVQIKEKKLHLKWMQLDTCNIYIYIVLPWEIKYQTVTHLNDPVEPNLKSYLINIEVHWCNIILNFTLLTNGFFEKKAIILEVTVETCRNILTVLS